MRVFPAQSLRVQSGLPFWSLPTSSPGRTGKGYWDLWGGLFTFYKLGGSFGIPGVYWMISGILGYRLFVRKAVRASSLSAHKFVFLPSFLPNPNPNTFLADSGIRAIEAVSRIPAPIHTNSFSHFTRFYTHLHQYSLTHSLICYFYTRFLSLLYSNPSILQQTLSTLSFIYHLSFFYSLSILLLLFHILFFSFLVYHFSLYYKHASFTYSLLQFVC